MMNRRTDIPDEIYQDEVVRFLAGLYHTTPRKVLQRFFEQNDRASERTTLSFRLEENEMEIIRDMIAESQIDK